MSTSKHPHRHGLLTRQPTLDNSTISRKSPSERIENTHVGVFRLGADVSSGIPSHPGKKTHIAHQSFARRNTGSLAASNSRFVNRKTSCERRADASMRLGGFAQTGGIDHKDTTSSRIEEKRKQSLLSVSSEIAIAEIAASHRAAESIVHSSSDSEADSSVSSDSSWTSSDCDSESDSDDSDVSSEASSVGFHISPKQHHSVEPRERFNSIIEEHTLPFMILEEAWNGHNEQVSCKCFKGNAICV